MPWFSNYLHSSRDNREFTVYINEGEKYQIEKCVERYPNIETGGDLFGAWIDDRTAVVQFVLGPGKYCRRTGGSFFQDIDYLREAGTYLTNKHGLCNIGQWHSHHRLGLTRPSGGDENTVWGNMPNLGLDRYIVLIATITGGSYSHEEELTVNIYPYLFEIKDGRRNDVQHGSFQSMERNSPFRLDKSIMKEVGFGAETINDVKTYRKRTREDESAEVTTKTPKMKPEAVQHNRAQSIPPNRENFDNDDKGISNEDEESRQSNIQQGGGTDRNLEDVSNEDEESGQSDIQGDGGTERNLEDVPNEKKENLTDIVSDKSSTSDDGIGQEQDRSQNNLAKGECFETHENDKDQAIADGHKIAGDNFRDSQSEKSSVPQDDSYLQTECDSNKKSEPTTPTSHEDECNEKQAEQRDAVSENPNTNSITISNTSGDAQLQAETVENVAKICDGISYLNLASVSIKECGYEMALTLYENALDIFRKLNDIHLQEKALTGLALSQFNLGKNKKAMESIKEAQKLPKDKCNTDPCEAKITNENKNSIEQGFSMAGPAESREETNNPCKFATIQESETVTGVPKLINDIPHIIFEWVNSVVEEACNPSRSERLGNEDLVCLEKYIKEFSTKCVYTHPASSKEPFTEKVRKSMTTNVKSLAYDNLLSQNKDKYGSKGNFVNEDQQIFNFAKADVRKNASTKKPAKLHKPLSTDIDAIGQISCGGIQGTCWLVTDKLVITNHHVYVMMNSEKVEKNNPNLPITVSFDYFNDEINESVVTVEVDEEQDPNLENPNLDYKFLRLKEHERLRDRDPLGPIVRSRQLQDGLVIIIGHPAEREMQEETCVVVSNHSWREKLKQRHEEFQQRKEEVQVSPGVHMTSEGLLGSAEKYKDCLPYDTSLFFGSSGSPVFDLKGNIVAMHTQGYTLDVEGKKCSLMEFGVQFRAICEDLKRYENLLEKLFPYYNLKNGEEQIPTERMDIDDSY